MEDSHGLVDSAIEINTTTLDGIELVPVRGALDDAEVSKPVSERPPAGGKSTLTGAIFNYVNSIVGAGIIGMPFAFKVHVNTWLSALCGTSQSN